ncbi:tail fiber protein [Providencia burhodogranariea]|uniref:Phage tail collar domain-containing protein n=1 Tax=Providencia burhodogranariea DSM 19968 TaxID=1141662 RepID=K8X1U8_9GAMM|nr:tail fiber protein [Providencia burhodogranariea]EKT62435.1 hypothetical protein OOA_07605 [Providencia burhodogranariea DSM 19968]
MSDIPVGCIVMFSGETIPNGWLLCNGKNGTPNLQDKFIVMEGPIFKRGSGNGTTQTKEKTIKGSVNVKETILTIKQIPPHSHEYQKTYTNTRKFDGEQWRSPYVGGYTSTESSKTGGGQGHSHQADFTSVSHSHEIEPIPPYYALAFIMYAG